MEKITFSSDGEESKFEDRLETTKISEQFFETKNNSDQMQSNEENAKWIAGNIPECDNIIKVDGKVVGFTFIMPCKADLMNKFISNKITERELCEQIKKSVNYDNFDTIYLCDSVIKPEYRRKGLAVQGMIKSIKKITEKRNIKPKLFYWGYTEAGKKTCEKVAKTLGLDILGK